MLKISCILTSYNRPKGVCEAISSVQAQTYPHWELFIVDDNSTPETQEIINRVAIQDPRCTIIQSGVRQEDRFKTARYATCINLAIPHVTGDLVTYLTDDDIYYPQRFEKMVDIFQKNPHVFIVYGRQRVVYLSDGKITRRFIRPLVGITRSPVNWVDHNSFMHRRSCLSIVKDWNDHPAFWKAADAQFFKKLVRHWDFYPLDFITDEHRIHEKGIQARLMRGEKPWEQKDAE